jgi:hypothetical protein
MAAHGEEHRISPRSAQVSISLGVYSTPALLTLLALCLATAHFMTLKYPAFRNPAIVRLFHMHSEAIVPTWFSSSLWLAAAFFLFSILESHRRRGYPYRIYWVVFAAIFLLLLSIDEVAQFHEAAGSVLGRALKGSEALRYTYASAMVTSILFAVVGIFFFSFFLKLQGRFRVLILASAVLFVSGAVIVESIGAAVEAGPLARFPLGQSWPRMVVYEELLEMLGVTLLIHTLLCILALDEAPYVRPEEPSHEFRSSGPNATAAPRPYR